VTNDIAALLERARQSAGNPDAAAPSAEDRQKLLKVAQEFESMLLVQVLKDMRKAGSWSDDEDEGDKSGFGAESMLEMADTELAGHLARVQGLGLSKQLLDAFDRMQGGGNATEPLSPVTSSRAVRTSSRAVRRAGPFGPAGIMPPPPPAMPELPPAVAAAFERLTQAASIAPTPDVAPSPESMAVAGSPTVPTVDGHITSNFGWRRDPFTGQSRFHRGVDLAAVYGQDVQAARAGRVVFSGEQRGYGNTVVVEHLDGTKTRYAHLSATLVEKGEAVQAGAPVGRAGHSGRATGTHVHFEITTADNGR